MCAGALCLCAGAPLFSQDSSQGAESAPALDSVILNEQPALTDESQIFIGASAPGQQTGGGSSVGTNSVWLLLRMIVVLAVVLALIYLLTRLMKRSIAPGVEDDQFLRKVASITLSPGKTVQVVTLIDKAYLVGVSDGGISLLAEITDHELIDAMNLYADKQGNTGRPRNFAEVLELFMPRQPAAQKNTAPVNKNVFADGASEQILESLKKQGERLQRGDE